MSFRKRLLPNCILPWLVLIVVVTSFILVVWWVGVEAAGADLSIQPIVFLPVCRPGASLACASCAQHPVIYPLSAAPSFSHTPSMPVSCLLSAVCCLLSSVDIPISS